MDGLCLTGELPFRDILESRLPCFVPEELFSCLCVAQINCHYTKDSIRSAKLPRSFIVLPHESLSLDVVQVPRRRWKNYRWPTDCTGN